MANWKRIIVSGSNAHLSQITSSVLTDTNILMAGTGGAIKNSTLTLETGSFNIGTNSLLSAGSASVLTGSFTGSFAGSANFNGSFTGSFTGSFRGDASLTGSFKGNADLTGSYTGSFFGDASLTGSFKGNANLTGSYSGSFFGDASLTGSYTGSFSGSGALHTLTVSENATIEKDLTVKGKITAEEYYTEYVSSSVIFASGSTKFGDTADDTHQFTGSIKVLGSITGSIDWSNIQNITLPSTQLFVGNASGIAQARTLSADATISNTGALTIANNAVTTVKIADLNVTTGKLADNAVTTVKITDLNVTTGKIADLGVTTAKIADLNVTTGKIAADAVTTAKIADLNVTNGKLADNAVTTIKITDLNVTTGKIADLNVTTGKIAADAVTTAKIADLNVTTAKIADLNVTTGKIADLGVTTGKIAADAVTTAKIADLNITEGKIAADAVTNTKLANMAVNTIKGRITAGTGDPEDLTAANIRTIINVADGANNYVHPTGFTSQPSAALTGANVISQITVSGEGHVTGVSERSMSLANLGYTVPGLQAVTDIGSSTTNSITAANFITTSDRRIKSEIEQITNPFETLGKVNSYEYIKDGKKEAGFIAQEVQEAIPYAVFEGDNGMLTMSDRPILAYLFAAVMELKEENKALKEELNKLK